MQVTHGKEAVEASTIGYQCLLSNGVPVLEGRIATHARCDAQSGLVPHACFAPTNISSDFLVVYCKHYFLLKWNNEQHGVLGRYCDVDLIARASGPAEVVSDTSSKSVIHRVPAFQLGTLDHLGICQALRWGRSIIECQEVISLRISPLFFYLTSR